MKRGLGLVATLFLLGMPAVLAVDSVLELFLGSSDESLIFLRLMYSMLLFILVFKVSKEQLFKDELKNLGLGFSLILALLVMRFTPDAWVEAFGWVVSIVAPLMILWTLTGVFIKGEKGKFSWGRLLLTAIGGLLIFFFLGLSPQFISGIDGTPYIGGFLDEMFTGINYYFLYNISDWIIGALAIGLIFIIFLLLSKIPGIGGKEGEGGGIGTLPLAFLAAFFVGLIIFLLPWIGGSIGGLGGIIIAGLEVIGVLLGIAFLIYCLYLLGKAGILSALGTWARNNWNWLLGILLVLLFILIFWFTGLWQWLISPWIFIPLIILTLAWLFGYWLIGRRQGGFLESNRLFVYLRVPQRDATTAIGTNIRLPAMRLGPGRRINIRVGKKSNTNFVFEAYSGRWKWTASRLPNATFTIRASNGATTPVSGTTDAKGEFPFKYAAPNVHSNATLYVDSVTHPDINPTYVTVVPYGLAIGQGIRPQPNVNVDVNNITDPGQPLYPGDKAQVIVHLQDGTGAGTNYNGINIAVTGLGPVGIADPFTATTRGGGAGATARIQTGIITIPGAAPVAYLLVADIDAKARGFKDPPDANATINVNDRTLGDLNVVVTPNPTAAQDIHFGQQHQFTIAVTDNASGEDIDTATITFTPNNRISGFSRTGAGIYQGYFRPVAGDATGDTDINLTVTVPNYNNGVGQIRYDVQDLPTLNVVPTWPIGPILVNDTQPVLVTLTNAKGAVVGGPGTNVILRARGPTGAWRNFGMATANVTSGQTSINFTPDRRGTWELEVSVDASTIGYKNPPNQPITILVNSPGALTLSSSPSASPINISDTMEIVSIVNDPTGPVTNATVAVTLIGSPAGSGISAGSLVNEIGPTSRTGEHRAQFTAVPGMKEGTYRFRITANTPTHTQATPATVDVVINKPTATPMNVATAGTPKTIKVEETALIQVQVSDSTGPVTGATVTIVPTSTVGGLGAVVMASPGIYQAEFTPPVGTPPTDYTFDISVSHSSYATTPGNPVIINVKKDTGSLIVEAIASPNTIDETQQAIVSVRVKDTTGTVVDITPTITPSIPLSRIAIGRYQGTFGPTTIGTYTFNVEAIDPSGTNTKGNASFTVTVTGKILPQPIIDLIDKIQGISLILPLKNSWFGKRSSPGTYLYNLISKEELQRYFLVHNRMKDLWLLLQNPDIKKMIPAAQLSTLETHLTGLERLRAANTGIESYKDVRRRLKSLFTAFIKISNVNQELVNDFNKYAGINLTQMNAKMILDTEDYLSWFIAHGAEIDRVLQSQGKGMFSMVELAKWIDGQMNLTVQMYEELQSTKKFIGIIRRSLKKLKTQ
jgi:hypothetical protein